MLIHFYSSSFRLLGGTSGLKTLQSLVHDDEKNKFRNQHQDNRLITVPVVTAAGHIWHIYLEFFDDGPITVYGPINLGSTESLLSTYTLVVSPRAIQEWIQTTFLKAMEEWVPGLQIGFRGSATLLRRTCRI
ncbi:hypothetical protein F4782DRAFT_81127 [Xylaria castorea]|nr:hypothetical protein F4782DRAFT_81127 [Xylaria castorea]